MCEVRVHSFFSFLPLFPAPLAILLRSSSLFFFFFPLQNKRVIDINSEKRELTYLTPGSHGGSFTTRFSLLVVDVGCETLKPFDTSSLGPSCILTKPISKTLHQVVQAEEHVFRKFNSTAKNPTSHPIKVVIAGAGVTGVGLAFALEARFATKGLKVECSLIGEVEEKVFGSPTMVRKVEQVLARRRIKHLGEQRMLSAVNGMASLQDRDWQLSAIPFDILVLATESAAPAWLRESTDLETDQKGFLLVSDTMRSTSCDVVFAAGDCCNFENHPTSSALKGGVYAAREGPVLINNVLETLREILDPEYLPQLQCFTPQEELLSLLPTGDQNAIGFKFGLTFQGKWVWRLKDWIDRTWMSRFATGHEDQNIENGHFPDPISFVRALEHNKQQRYEKSDFASVNSSVVSLFGSSDHDLEEMSDVEEEEEYEEERENEESENDFAEQWAALNLMSSNPEYAAQVKMAVAERAH